MNIVRISSSKPQNFITLCIPTLDARYILIHISIKDLSTPSSDVVCGSLLLTPSSPSRPSNGEQTPPYCRFGVVKIQAEVAEKCLFEILLVEKGDYIIF